MRIIITGGGTGGHLFPGIALATALQQREKECQIMFIGTRRQLDRETLAGFDFLCESVSCMGLKGKGLLHRLKSLASLPAAVLQAGRIVQQFKPDLVFGVGGYVTGPVLLAARLQGIPTCIHEQNSVPGLANRMISRFVSRVFISIPAVSFPIRQEKIVFSGNPVRREILAAAEDRVRQPLAERKKKTLLVMGGSLGAHRINLLMLDAMAILGQECQQAVTLIHQTGSADADRVRGGYAAAGIKAEVAPFFKDMAALYRRADLVVARAGATSLAELAVMGLPALLIPYPYATDDHQAKNGQYYAAGGGACMYRETELDAALLAGKIAELLTDSEKLNNMAEAMEKMAKPDATDRILDNCMELIGHGVTGRAE
jgi:UDP-N-acetylglucosamine--N-acetylmuramyl-(pentapeptide) pyrophosphoryl-undecaprenol N-acetylglucosamine transferase